MTQAPATGKQPLETAVEPAAETTPADAPHEPIDFAERAGVADRGEAGAPDDDGGEARAPVDNPVFAQRASIADRFKAQRQTREEAIAGAAHARAADDAADGDEATGAGEQPDAPQPAGGERRI